MGSLREGSPIISGLSSIGWTDTKGATARPRDLIDAAAAVSRTQDPVATQEAVIGSYGQLSDSMMQAAAKARLGFEMSGRKDPGPIRDFLNEYGEPLYGIRYDSIEPGTGGKYKFKGVRRNPNKKLNVTDTEDSTVLSNTGPEFEEALDEFEADPIDLLAQAVNPEKILAAYGQVLQDRIMAGSPKTAADLKAKEAQAANFEQEKALRAAQTREGEAKATLAEQGLAQASRTQKTKEEILRLRKQAKNLTPEQRDKMLGQAQDLEDEMAYLTSGSAGPREQLPAAAQFAEWGVGKRVFPGRKEALDYYNTAKDRSPEAQRAELFKLVAQADKLATPEEIRSRVDELAPVFFGAPRTAMPLAASPALRGSPAATGGPAVKQPGARLIGKSAKDGRNVWENPDGTRVKGD